MNNKSLIKNLLSGFAVLALTTALISCKKNDVDEFGSANLKVVNASPASSPQGFFLANSTVIKGSLAYGDESDYIVTNSGNNLEAQFRNDGSSAAYATSKFEFNNGKNYSIFLAGDGQAARIKVFTDDMIAPAAGQAKVRFIHLSDAAPTRIDIKNGSGDNLVVNLERDNSSNYVTLAPGILSMNVYGANQTTSLGNYNVTAFLANKIYTVYITGTTIDDIEVHQLSHN